MKKFTKLLFMRIAARLLHVLKWFNVSSNQCSVVMDLPKKNGLKSDGITEKLLEPYTYIATLKGKQIRDQLSKAFNHWLNVEVVKLDTIMGIIEKLHNSSLVIDDIEDSSPLRRGVPSAHIKYGVPHSINAANFVYFIALDDCLKLGYDACKIFTHHMLELHHGQGCDIYWRDNLSCPTEEEYIKMASQKTGGLFMLAVSLMSLCSENTAMSSNDDLFSLVRDVGIFFQVRDDLANLVSDEYKAKKGFADDLTEGKFSFPIIHAVKNDTTNYVLDVLGKHSADDQVKQACVDFMRSTTDSFAYTTAYLVELEAKIRAKIHLMGGNPKLEKIIDVCAKLYGDKCDKNDENDKLSPNSVKDLRL